MKKADLVALGKVARSQGRDGRIKLRLIEKGPTGFGGSTVFIRRGEDFEAFEVEALVLDRNAYVLKLKGVDTLAAADALAGLDIYAAATDFRRLGRDLFYDFQVIGCRVRTRDGTEIGEVASVLAAGGPVVLVVRRGSGDVYVPFTEAICVKVDPEAREVVIDPPDGLLDLNEI
ncbi:MAG: ribosome maturation factor RimM [Candidatus Aminicenantes bacterium]|nr:ribosome maturation factor RimM [Candidatus Aminicenantes bacterium]